MTEENDTTNSPNGKPPVHAIRHGRIRASIWANCNGSSGYFFNTTFEKIYQNNDGEWASTGSFSDLDLLPLSLAATAAYEWISLKKQNAVTTEINSDC